MKHLRKITLLLAVFALLFSISCGSDDEETVDLSEVEFAFDVNNPPIDQTLITNLGTTGGEGAVISGYLGLANALTGWVSLFQEPGDAEQSNVPIGTCGGNAVVYSYSYAGNGESFTVAYQVCETSDKYIF